MKSSKQDLLAFLAEMEKNLEIFYVMDQRQFITEEFLLEAWAKVKDDEMVQKHPSIASYAAALEEFNRLLKESKEPDNARKLHGLKQELDKRLKGMEVLIIPAGQILEKEMLDMGLLRL